MILILIKHLHQFCHVPSVFEYTSFRMAMAALTALVLTIFCGQMFIRKLYALKIGQPIRKEECPLLGKLHEKKEDTPTMGGILILVSMLVSLVIWMDLSHPFTWILLITTLLMGSLGALDDYLKLKKRNSKGLSGRKKFMVQTLFSLLLAGYLLGPFSQKEELLMSSLYIPFIKGVFWQVSGWALIVLAFFWVFVINGWTNAVNLTDGLDGLAAGNLVMVASAVAIIGFVSNHYMISNYLNIVYLDGSGEIAVYMSSLVGGCLGFLWYNSHPAQVFMGDTGSLALGAIIGVSSILLRREILLALIGGVFVIEAASVILQVASFKFRNKKRIFLCAPLHHHFEYKGYPETKVVLRFWIIGFVLSVIGVVSIKFQ